LPAKFVTIQIPNKKVGLVAGGGGLPAALARRMSMAERPFFVVRLKGFADDGTAEFPGADIGVAELGKIFKTLKDNHCEAVCFAGLVSRPDLGALKPDLKGLSLLPGVIGAAAKGDDALMRHMLSLFEAEGFEIEGADQLCQELTLPAGVLGAVEPRHEDALDIETALRAARAIGAIDAGQAAVSARGLILALEAQEGTDSLLARCAHLPQSLRGSPEARIGVLAKTPKPIQELRIDMPTIGVSTVRRAAQAGLVGIVGEAGRLLIVDKDAVVAEADALGLFIVGVDPS
jgi:hypothetical protein